MLANKSLIFAAAIAILIATLFWTQSRVPALNEKAQMGDRVNISAIAVDVLYPIDPEQPYLERVVKTAANWSYTNWKGMTFGLLFAAAFLSLLQFVSRPWLGSNRFFRSLGGLFLGVPLGVCVNCATPIAYGMFRSGLRLEYALAMLLSSPTLNVIVVTMAFSLLPFHLALMKVVVSVLVILLVVPFLVKLSASAVKNPETATTVLSDLQSSVPDLSGQSCDVPTENLSWARALARVLLGFWNNLRFIVWHTLPLMIIAGLLGAALIEALPSGDLASLEPGPVALSLFALIGTFLPVPIAFDVLATSALIQGGLPAGLAGTLLFSLGIFSIYPALIIARNISVTLSCLMFASVMVVAIGFGYVSGNIDSLVNQNAKSILSTELASSTRSNVIEQSVAECESFSSPPEREFCLRMMLANDMFTSVSDDDCRLLESRERLQHSPAASGFCRQVRSLHTTRSRAIAQKNIKLCQELRSAESAAICVGGYVQEHGLSISSVDVCDELSDSNLRRDCRVHLIESRLIMANLGACEIGLTEPEMADCIDRLNGRIAADLEHLEACATLSSNQSRSVCQRNVFVKQVFVFHDYAICDELTDRNLAMECSMMALSDRALQNNDSALCNQMPQSWMRVSCRVGLAVQNVRREQGELHFAEFEDNQVELAKSSQPTSVLVSESGELPGQQEWTSFYSSSFIDIDFIEHATRQKVNGRFLKLADPGVTGLDSPWTFGISDFLEPFKYGKGVASGDFNNDGWPDLAFASDTGASVYRNDGNGRFSLYARLSPPGSNANSFVVTFVDIDNDGWQDLFLSVYGGANYFFGNEEGRFSSDNLIELARDNQIVTLAAGFADLDRDGDLDFVLGNWSYGAEKGFTPEHSTNAWYTNSEIGFTRQLPDEFLGDTLSVLLSDVNHDAAVDQLVANDRQVPDVIYFGDGAGNFKKISSHTGVFPIVSLNNMSYESADFNNDLLLDIFSTDMSFGPGEDISYCDALHGDADRGRCEWLLTGMRALRQIDVAWCSTLQEVEKRECLIAMAIEIAKRGNDETLCMMVPTKLPGKQELCRRIAQKVKSVDQSGGADALPQKQSNIILLNSQSGRFFDATDTMGVGSSYWSWNSRAADLDNDGWQDIYIGNGFDFGIGTRGLHSNILFKNQRGQKFTRAEENFGLSSYANTPSYTYLDLDVDGDIDIVNTNVMSSPSIYLNQATSGNSISFLLRDFIGNRFCVGCKIIVRYGNDGMAQIRELKLSGGFLSFDNPVMYFGIGDALQIDSISVIWSTGEEWTLQQSFKANRQYRITRRQ